MSQRTHIDQLSHSVGQEVTIMGWVHNYRDQGKMVFLDIRDRSGIVQAVVLSGSPALEVAKTLRSEFVISATGIINERPEKQKKLDILNGSVEMEILSISVLNTAETPAFEITDTTIGVDEETRMRNRYLDLRSIRMRDNMVMRSRTAKFIRDRLEVEGFLEIETPLLTKSTPEGARDYVVPSRVYPGYFYALPQSPQQYKQLLMSAGMERYFQVAKCLRDEDSRGDRQPEFTQIDMELSFVEREDVMQLNERVLIDLVTTLYPEKRIQQIPFPRITYRDAMEQYNSDRPDIREDKNDPNLLAFCWVIDFPFFESTETSDNPDTKGSWTFTHNPFSAAMPEFHENLMNKQDIGSILTSQYDITLNGYEIGGGSIRNHKAEALMAVFDILGYSPESITENFGHMLRAFRSGTPPHGGIAWGFDRLVMLLQNEPNIREVIAFPKNRSAQDLLMESPSAISEKQLKELSIQVQK
jgi:aspartyl-tRNA synthetase